MSNNSSQRDNPVVKAFIGLASIGIVFLVLNGILWACQEATSGESKAEFMEKKAKLDALSSEVESCQASLDTYKSMAVGNALDSENYDSYKSDLASCNGLVDQYNQGHLEKLDFKRIKVHDKRHTASPKGIAFTCKSARVVYCQQGRETLIKQERSAVAPCG